MRTGSAKGTMPVCMFRKDSKKIWIYRFPYVGEEGNVHMPAIYPIDLIAKRDQKYKMDHSIIKNWNVHYQTLEEVEEEMRQKRQKSEKEQANEAQESLNGSAQEGQMLQGEEELLSEDAYNAKTGAYSGNYGNKPIENEEEKQQIHAILTEKPDAFTAAMSAMQGND